MPRLVQSEAITDLEAVRDLKIEIEIIEAQHGPNPYSNYLRKHGKRPPPNEAAAIGKVFGCRVKADDGSMQPPLSVADKSALKAIKSRRKEYARRYEQVARIKAAIATFAEIKDELPKVIDDWRSVSNSPETLENADIGLYWMTRFVELWHGQISIKDPEAHNRDHQQAGA